MEQAGQSALPVFAAGAASCVREDIPGERRGAVLIYHFTTVIVDLSLHHSNIPKYFLYISGKMR